MLEKINEIREKLAKIDQDLSNPEVLRDSNKIQELGKNRAELAPIVDAAVEYESVLSDLEDADILLEAEDEETREFARAEKDELEKQAEEIRSRMEELLLPKDVNDDRNIIIEIRAGAGGEEAALFSANLFRMYCRYAEREGWKVELLTTHPTGIGGLKEVIFSIKAKGAFSRLKYEGGVHRVQRVPETEASGRIHTSTATVAVLPEAEDVDIELKDEEVRIDRFCSSGPGGQGVNTTYSAVRLTHIPSGLVVSCQDERSQIKNLAKAKRVLRTRLLERQMAEQQAEARQDRIVQVGSGQRNEKIRTYNYPQTRVTDHRINFTSYRLNEILDGDLEELITALNVANRAQILARMQKQEVRGG